MARQTPHQPAADHGLSLEVCPAAIAGAGLSVIPGVGTAIGIGAAAAAAGLDLTAINSKTGVEFEAGDQLVHASNGKPTSPEIYMLCN